jgi:hypothetical protein
MPPILATRTSSKIVFENLPVKSAACPPEGGTTATVNLPGQIVGVEAL